MSSRAILAEGLTRSYGARVAVAALDLEVERGEIFGFLGPNGAGKTTTLRMLSGLLAPSGGRAEVLGIDVGREPERVKASIAYMAQGEVLYGDLTVAENARFMMSLYGIPGSEREALLDETLRLLGLHAFRDRRAEGLSGGERRLLALACAVATRQQLLVLDEPTAGLDPERRVLVWDVLHRLRREGATIFVTTHYMDDADRCLRLALIGGGRLLAVGTPEELTASFPYTTLELSGKALPEPEEAAALPGTARVAVRGARLRVHVEPQYADAAERRFREAGATVRRAQADLEDLFLELTGARRHGP